MECNKEEALKAKQFAEMKVERLDFAGAKRLALKAQNLYPQLEGLPQFLATLDVYLSAEKGTNGQVDWYKVLGVEPYSDEETVQTKFKKLALFLHPDKNKSAGADGAFQLISEARKILGRKKQIFSSTYDGVPDGTSWKSTAQTQFHDFFKTRDERSATPTVPSATPTVSSVTPTVPSATPDMPSTASPAMPHFTHTMPSGASLAMPHFTCTMPSGASPAPPAVPSAAPPAKPSAAPPAVPSAAPPAVPSAAPPAVPSAAAPAKPRSSSKHRAVPTQPGSTSRPQKGRKTTFWTICSSCKMYFEYLRTFLNHKLQCHNCKKHFIAYKIPAPKNASKSRPFHPQQQKVSQPTMPNNSSDPGRTHVAATDVRSSGISSLFNSTGVESVQATASTSSQAAGSSHPAVGQFNRGQKEWFPYKEVQQAFNKPDHPFLPTGSHNTGFSAVPNGVKSRRRRHWWREYQTTIGTGNGGVAMNNGFGTPKFSSGTGGFDVASSHRLNCRRDLSHAEMQNMLLKKAKKELVKKLDKSSIPSVPRTADADVKEKGMNTAAAPCVKPNMTGSRVSVDAKDMPRQMSPTANSHVDSDVEDGNTNSMSVPDPDFHDFDNDRTEKSFGSNQVWAVYDEDDGMPRYYAMVHSVMSLKPFKIRISWLNSKTNHELAPLDWVACGFPKTSGDLWIGKHEVYKYLHSFSHKVKWTKGRRGAVSIYPGKGDVWALYRNWSPNWDEHTPDEVIHKYDMVQVLEDYNEERGVSIVPLVKVAGFKTVFRQHSDRSRIKTIPREEMFRFSHQVPVYMLSGVEGEKAPNGCLELDPASTPLELLQVKTEAQIETEETAGKCNGGENGKVTKERGLVEDGEEKDLADLMKRENDLQATEMRVYSRKRPREEQAVESAKRLQL